MNRKTPTLRYTTPAGIAVWPYLRNPDTKFQPDGEYRVKLRYTGKVGKQVVADISRMRKDGVEQMCKEHGRTKLKEAAPPFTEEEDGSILLTVKLKAGGTRKDGVAWTQRPAVFDSSGRPIAEKDIPNIGGGSVLKACVEVVPYFSPAWGAGITLRLKGVQVITLVEYGDGEGDASQMGFTAEEDGYVVGGESFPLEEGAVTVPAEDSDETDF